MIHGLNPAYIIYSDQFKFSSQQPRTQDHENITLPEIDLSH